MGKVKMMRCPEECGKQWRPKQGKSGWQKQKEKVLKKEEGMKYKVKGARRRKKTKERKKDGSKKSRKRVEDLGQGRRSRKADTKKVLQVNLCA